MRKENITFLLKTRIGKLQPREHETGKLVLRSLLNASDWKSKEIENYGESKENRERIK